MDGNKKLKTGKDIKSAMEEEFAKRNLDSTDPSMKKIKQNVMRIVINTKGATINTVRDAITTANETNPGDERAA